MGFPDEASGPYEAVGHFPLSHNQKDFWFLHHNAPHSAAFNDAVTMRIRSRVDVPALRRACRALAERHPVLRTVFPVHNGAPVQFVHEPADVCFEELDAAGCDEDELRRRVIQAHQRPFDLELGPVWRASLFRRADADYVLLLTIHEIACDAWSCGIILQELGELYAAEAQAAVPDPPGGNSSRANLPPSAPYTDYTRWQHKRLAGAAGERSRSYWRQRLSDAFEDSQSLALPTDRPLPAVRTYRGASHGFRLEAELIGQLRSLAEAEQATLFTTLLTAYQVLLARCTGQTRVPIGVPMSGRSRSEFYCTVGNVMNPVIVNADISNQPTFREFLAHIKQLVRGGLMHQDFPFSEAIKQAQSQLDHNNPSAAHVFFNMPLSPRFKQFAPVFWPQQTSTPLDWGGLAIEPFVIPQQEGQFLLGFDIWEASEACLVSEIGRAHV